jgi:hypothetical protein
MSKQSPLQIVNSKFGSKKDLAKKLAELLEPGPDESKEELATRLSFVSNAKLLHLQLLADKIATHGGRDGLVQKIAAAEQKSKDKDYIAALTKSRSLGWLVDRLEVLTRRASAKKAS